MTSMRRRGVTFGGVVFANFIGYFVILMVPLAFWTQRNLDFVLTIAKGKPVLTPWILNYGIAFLSPLAIIFNIVAEIYRAYVAA